MSKQGFLNLAEKLFLLLILQKLQKQLLKKQTTPLFLTNMKCGTMKEIHTIPTGRVVAVIGNQQKIGFNNSFVTYEQVRNTEKYYRNQ